MTKRKCPNIEWTATTGDDHVDLTNNPNHRQYFLWKGGFTDSDKISNGVTISKQLRLDFPDIVIGTLSDRFFSFLLCSPLYLLGLRVAI